MKKFAMAILAAALCVGAASAFDEIPVYGGSKVGYEDRDLLDGTILEEGVLVVTPEEPWRVFIGDGITPGGLEVRPKDVVTNFADVASATTNLNMHSYSIVFGPWRLHGDLGEFDVTWGGEENWLRLIRDTGQAFLAYDMTIIDAMHYKFTLNWTGTGDDFPVLQVSPNLTQGYQNASVDDVTYARLDSSHLEILYSVPEELADYVFLGFRLFEVARLASGAYFGVPVVAENGVNVTGGLSIEGYDESYHDENAEEDRDRHVDGTLTLNGVTWTNLPDLDGFATTDALAAAVARIGTLETNAGTHATRDWTVGYVATNHQSLAGYATEEWVGEQGFLTEHQSLADYALTSWTIGYVATNHQSLAGYATESWVQGRGYLTEHQSLAGLASESWVAGYVSTNHQSLAGLASETWVSDYVATNHQSLAGLASETWVEGYVSTNHQSLSGYATEAWTEAYISTNHQDLSGYATTSAVASVSDRVGAIEADYVQADDIAGFATTSTVASVAGRVAALEYPETCALYWDPDFVTSNWNAESSVIYVPTDFPTKRLDLVVCDNGISNLYVRLPGWQPDRDVEVVICVLRDTGDSVGRASRVQYLNQLLINHTAANNYRLLICDYDSFAKTWSFYPQTLASRPYYGTTSRKDFPSNRPATVEEWLALYSELASP